MGHPTSPTPRIQEKGQGRFISEEMNCKSCGYDLRGLNYGQKCPECGTIISVSIAKGGRYSGLGHAPERFLTVLTVGLLMIGLSVPLDFIAEGITASGGLQAIILTIVPSLMWFGGVLLVCRRRPNDPGYTIGEWEDRFRRLTIVLQVAMLLSEGAEALLYFATPGTFLEQATVIAGAVFAFAGAIGFFPFAVYLSYIADWGSDTRLGHRLRAVAWCLAASSLVLVTHYSVDTLAELAGHQGHGFFGFVRGVLGLATLPGFVVFYVAQLILIVSLIQLLAVVGWAKRNAGSEVERDQRVMERRAERAEELVHVSQTIEGPDTSDLLPAAGGGRTPAEGEEPEPELPKEDTRTPEELMGRDLDAYGLEADE